MKTKILAVVAILVVMSMAVCAYAAVGPEQVLFKDKAAISAVQKNGVYGDLYKLATKYLAKAVNPDSFTLTSIVKGNGYLGYNFKLKSGVIIRINVDLRTRIASMPDKALETAIANTRADIAVRMNVLIGSVYVNGAESMISTPERLAYKVTMRVGDLIIVARHISAASSSIKPTILIESIVNKTGADLYKNAVDYLASTINPSSYILDSWQMGTDGNLAFNFKLADSSIVNINVNPVTGTPARSDVLDFIMKTRQTTASKMGVNVGEVRVNGVLKYEYFRAPRPGEPLYAVKLSIGKFSIGIDYAIGQQNESLFILRTLVNTETGVDLYKNAIDKLKGIFNPTSYILVNWGNGDGCLGFVFKLPDGPDVKLNISIETGELMPNFALLVKAVMDARNEAAQGIGTDIKDAHINNAHEVYDEFGKYIVTKLTVSINGYALGYIKPSDQGKLRLESLVNTETGVDLYKNAADYLASTINPSSYTLDSWQMNTDETIGFDFKLPDGSIIHINVNVNTGEPYNREIEIIKRVNGPNFNFDFNGDGKLTNSEDYSSGFKWLVGYNSNLLVYLTPEARAKLDLNKDGTLDMNDILMFNELTLMVERVNNTDFNFDFNGDGKLTVDDYILFKVFDGGAGDLPDMQIYLTPEAKEKLDINKDGVVDENDVGRLGEQIAILERVNDPNFNFDFNGDGKLDVGDYSIFKLFDGGDGDILPAYLTPEARVKLDINKDGIINEKDVIAFGEMLSSIKVKELAIKDFARRTGVPVDDPNIVVSDPVLVDGIYQVNVWHNTLDGIIASYNMEKVGDAVRVLSQSYRNGSREQRITNRIFDAMGNPAQQEIENYMIINIMGEHWVLMSYQVVTNRMFDVSENILNQMVYTFDSPDSLVLLSIQEIRFEGFTANGVPRREIIATYEDDSKTQLMDVAVIERSDIDASGRAHQIVTTHYAGCDIENGGAGDIIVYYPPVSRQTVTVISMDIFGNMVWGTIVDEKFDPFSGSWICESAKIVDDRRFDLYGRPVYEKILYFADSSFTMFILAEVTNYLVYDRYGNVEYMVIDTYDDPGMDMMSLVSHKDIIKIYGPITIQLPDGTTIMKSEDFARRKGFALETTIVGLGRDGNLIQRTVTTNSLFDMRGNVIDQSIDKFLADELGQEKLMTRTQIHNSNIDVRGDAVMQEITTWTTDDAGLNPLVSRYQILTNREFDDRHNVLNQMVYTYDEPGGMLIDMKEIRNLSFDARGNIVSQDITTRAEDGTFIDRRVIENISFDIYGNVTECIITTYDENGEIIEVQHIINYGFDYPILTADAQTAPSIVEPVELQAPAVQPEAPQLLSPDVWQQFIGEWNSQQAAISASRAQSSGGSTNVKTYDQMAEDMQNTVLPLKFKRQK